MAARDLFGCIDALELSARNRAWHAAMKSAPSKIYADRERWTVKSWRETEGEDIQIRRAKLVACILDNLKIKIHAFDEIVGRPTPGVIGCCTAIDVNGDYIPGLLDGGEVRLTMDMSAEVGDDVAVFRESVELFGGHTMREATYHAWRQVAGTWAEDAEAAKLKDPSLDSVITGQSTSTLSWNKILRVGLRGYIDECRVKIEDFISSGETDINRLYFWQSAIITLEAVIRHAKRYAELTRSMAATETVTEQREHLLKIADTCEYVPENPARTFREALQSMQFCNLAKMLENPAQNNCHWGRADQ